MYPLPAALFSGESFDGQVNSNATQITAQQGRPVFTRTGQPPVIPPPLADDDCLPNGVSPQGQWTAKADFISSGWPVKLKITGQPDGTYRAEAELLAIGLKHIPVTDFAWHQPMVKLTLLRVGFEGRLDAVGSELDGSFIAGGTREPGIFQRAAAEVPLDFENTNRTDFAGHCTSVLDMGGTKYHLGLNAGRLPGGKFLVTLDLPDLGVAGIRSTLVHRSRDVYVGIQWGGTGCSFEGQLTEDKFAGTFRGEGAVVPVVFKRNQPGY